MFSHHSVYSIRRLAGRLSRVDNASRFRDTYVMSLPDGAAAVAEYYNSAPILLNCIDRSNDRINILSEIFQWVSATVTLVESGHCAEAKALYTSMFRILKNASASIRSRTSKL